MGFNLGNIPGRIPARKQIPGRKSWGFWRIPSKGVEFLSIIYTLGHSNHSFSYFADLLQKYGINLVVDVRSIPYSRPHPQFRKDNLEKCLLSKGLSYCFLGRELGGKRDEQSVRTPQGRIDYELVRGLSDFQRGLEYLEGQLSQWKIPALVCAEKDPLRCHRFFLITPALLKKEWPVKHILADGETISHEEGEEIFLKQKTKPSLFTPAEEVLKNAYRWGRMGNF